MTYPIYEDTRRRDWLIYVLLASAVYTLPRAIQASGWVPEPGRLLYATLWAGLAGVVLGRSRLSGWTSWLLGVALGLVYSLQFAGRLLPRPGLLLSDLGRALASIWNLVVHRSLIPYPPFSRSVSHLLAQTVAMNQNLLSWLQAIRDDSVNFDTTALWLGVSFGIWMLTWNAAYEMLRRKRAFVALIPLGVGVVVNVSVTYIGINYVHLYLLVTMLTLAWANIGRKEAFWAGVGLDYSRELHRDVLVIGSVLAVAVLLVALLVPYVTYDRAVLSFWAHFGPAFESFYGRLDRAFAGRNPIPEPTPSIRQRALSSHDVRGGLPVGDSTIFLVQTSDPIPLPEDVMMMEREGPMWEELLPRRYWRQRTYDVYTGVGWDSGERHSQRFESNTPWIEASYPHTVVTQTFWLMEEYGGFAFGVNEPVNVDEDYGVLIRGESDLVAFSVDSDMYSVVSLVPSATSDQLRSAETEYPDWVKERYLHLPDLPERVRQMAEGIVGRAEAVTRYDKARAIEK